jgi:hypothetical protein
VPRRQELISLIAAVALATTAIVGVATKDGDAVASRVSSPAATSSGSEAPDGAPAASAPSTGAAPSSATVAVPGATTPPASSKAAAVPVRRTTGPPIKVGVHVGDNTTATARFGVAGLPNVDPKEIDAVVRAVNTAGGLAGRPIVPVYHQTDPANGPWDTQNQTACDDFASDKKVPLVVANVLAPSPVLMECLAKHKIPLVYELHTQQITNAEAARLRGYIYRPSMPNAERLGVVVDGLAKAGFFKGAKVGIIRYDDATATHIAKKVFRPRLTAHDVQVVSEYAMPHPTQAADATQASTHTTNAVIQFRDDDVSHVLFVPSGGVIPLLFMTSAQSQSFYPKYGISSQDAPGFLSENFDERVLGDTLAVGWAPELDGDATARRSPANARCRKALADAGLPWDSNLEPFCDGFFFLQQALADAATVTVDTLRAGAESLGTSFDSPYVFGTRFTSGHTDGPRQAKILRFDAGAEAFRYTGGFIGF